MVARIPAAVVSVVVVAALAACTATTPEPAPSADFGRRPSGVATRTGPFESGPVKAPADKVWVGAWVKPEVWGQAGRRDAVAGVEKSLGRRFDVINTYRTFDEKFWTETDKEYVKRGSIVMVSWASGDTRSMLDGRHDDTIRAQAKRVARAKRPVMMRFRWEMDRPNLRATMWSPEDYVAAWKYTRRIFQEEGATNASWVWCPTAEGFDRGDAPAFYPGDDQVDWTCVDVYASSEYRPIDQLMGNFLKWAAQRPKPIIVGEFGVAREWGPERRAAWMRDATRVFKANPQIRAVAYFDSDPDDNPRTLHFKISDDEPAFAAFRDLAGELSGGRP
ncbi:glycosyl hydrolase [Asanoa sp. NPDC050611]|uniref:glycosyl hydrolase n=1 Tax=Asanoa sp. NPDC050611 TaxID=3157098 RepID=UPI0033D954C9